MNFCGIITTFSLACVLFMFDKLLSKPGDVAANVNFKSAYFFSALASLIVSAFLLFRQRSNLAHRYGQISLEATVPGLTGKSTATWLNEVDAWEFWNFYNYAIALIKCAFLEIFALLLITFYKDCQVAKFFSQFSVIISSAIVIIGIIIIKRIIIDNKIHVITIISIIMIHIIIISIINAKIFIVNVKINQTIIINIVTIIINIIVCIINIKIIVVTVKRFSVVIFGFIID